MPDGINLADGNNRLNKRKRVLRFLILLLGLLGACVLTLNILPFYLFPFQIPFIPKDSSLISRTLSRELPGYSDIDVLAAKGSNQFGDPRLITVKVLIETGEVPVECVGQIFSWFGDPGNSGIRWQTLDCQGLATLVGYTRMSLTTADNPYDTWYPPFFKCFNDQIASVLYYWAKQDKSIFSRIGWPDIVTTVDDMLAGKREVEAQIRLFDPEKVEFVDYDPQLQTEQKVKQYYLECDGTVKVYLAESNMDIYNSRNSAITDFPLMNPFEDDQLP
ncbi:MAG TPA: hypothetical protein VN364_04150 [Bellilinea sp.]|nr:hypothetical protein [Bellilinea sp.]